MSFDRKDFQDAAARRVTQTTKTASLATARQALALAVECDTLTGIESWDRYRTILEGHARQFESLAANWQEKLLDPENVNHDELMKMKARYAMAATSASVFRYCVQLPVTLTSEKPELAAEAERLDLELQKLLDSVKTAA